jgi:nucleotide-binding universal stress UspA family protein
MRTIVVGTDGSANADLAVEQAAEIAKGSGATVHLVTAYPDDPAFGETIASSAKQDRVNLREVAEGVLVRVARGPSLEGVDVTTHASAGDPARVILDIADELDADLIMVGARGLTAFERFLLGSVSSKLSHHSKRSLMIVRED